MTASISRRLVLWLAVPLTLLALCGALIHYFNSVAPGVITGDKRLRDAASALSVHVEFKEGQFVLDKRDQRRVGSGAGSPIPPVDDSTIFALRDSQGALLAGDPRLRPAPLPSGVGQAFALAPINRGNVRTLTSRLITPQGALTLTVADAAKINEAAARFGFMSTLLWDFVQLDVTLVLVWVGIQLGLKPVKKLRDEIAERSPLDLRPIAESTVPRELAPLTATLNRLFLMLRTSVQSQQQFIANTAHQLRTPITGMLAQLDLLATDPAAQSIKHRLVGLQEGMRQLAHASNQLLTLARADPAVNITTKSQIVDINHIVSEVVAKFFDRALQCDIDLGVESQSVSILADPSLIDDLLSNLVDNALKYTPAGGSVTVSAGRDPQGKPFLQVEDTGPGIPEAERQRVRQRFYRLPNSPGHGSGLGLAIVEEIAKLYGGQLMIGAVVSGAGTVMRVEFSGGM